MSQWHKLPAVAIVTMECLQGIGTITTTRAILMGIIVNLSHLLHPFCIHEMFYWLSRYWHAGHSLDTCKDDFPDIDPSL